MACPLFYLPLMSCLFPALHTCLTCNFDKPTSCVPVYMLSCFSCVWLFVTLWTSACQAPLSVGFSRQEYWSGLPCPPPGVLLNPVIEPMSLKAPPGKPHKLKTLAKMSKDVAKELLWKEEKTQWWDGRRLFSSVVQSWPTLCDPMDCHMPGFPVHH